MAFVDGIQEVLQCDKAILCKKLGISRATLHRWQSKGLPPVMSIGGEQRLQSVVFEALGLLKANGDEGNARKLMSAFQRQKLRDREALKAWSLSDLRVYRHDEIVDLRPTIEEARQLWAQKCIEYFQANGDKGSCVLGAGFYLSFLPDGSKKPRAWLFLPADSVTPYQGSFVWENSIKEIHDFLRKKGIECEYDYGNMD